MTLNSIKMCKIPATLSGDKTSHLLASVGKAQTLQGWHFGAGHSRTGLLLQALSTQGILTRMPVNGSHLCPT